MVNSVRPQTPPDESGEKVAPEARYQRNQLVVRSERSAMYSYRRVSCIGTHFLR